VTLNLLKRLRNAPRTAATRLVIGIIGAVLVAGVGLLQFYRQKGAVPSVALKQPAPAPAPVVAALPPEEPRAPVVYQSKGRRDPFRQVQPPPAPKEPDVNLKVTGIAWGARAYYAVVEPQPPDGKGYIIRENDIVDSVRVLKITRDSVIFEAKTVSADGKPFTRHVRKTLGP
jgi:hypothetical protein